MDNRKFVLAAIMLLMYGALVHWPESREAEARVSEPVEESTESFYQRMNEKASLSGIHWELGAYLVAVRDETARIPGITEARAWRELTEDSIRAIAKRREDIVAWTRGNGQPPIRVAFIGVIHKESGITPEQRDVTVRSQAAVLSLVRDRSSEIDVITIESAGAIDGPVTWDGYVDIVVDAYDRYQGIRIDPLSLKQLLIAEAVVDADITMLRSSGFPPIIFGEELAPNQLHYWLIGRAGNAEIASMDEALLLNGLLKKLRSELAVIRALEFLRKNGGSEAVVTQGYGHGEDYVRFAADYNVAFDQVIPVPPLEMNR